MMNLNEINEFLKNDVSKSLKEKFVFRYKGKVYLLSTADITHGDERFAKNISYYIARYETKLFRVINIDEYYDICHSEELWAMTYSCKDDAKAEHEALVKQIKKRTADELYRSINARDRR